MKIAVYTICYNEQDLLPYFLRHYRQYAERIVLYDNESTDASVRIASDGGCIVRTFKTQGQIRDDIMLVVKDKAWMECKKKGYDWIFVVDVDEFIYHPSLIEYLEYCNKKRFTICVPTGYQMVHPVFPSSDEQLYMICKRGVISTPYSKPCIFKPDDIKASRFSAGCHNGRFTGRVIINNDNELKLLHYNQLGLDNYIARISDRARRLSALNRRNRWGHHYLPPIEEHIKNFENLLSTADYVI